MKKVLTIFFFTLVLFFSSQVLFAETGEYLVISTKVENIEPVFKLQGTFNTSSSWVDGKTTGEELNPASNIDLTIPSNNGSFLNEVKAYFRVVQTNDVRSSKTYKITITATELKNTNSKLSSNNTTQNVGWFLNDLYSVSSSPLTVTPTDTGTSGTGTTYTLTAAYSNGHFVAKDTVLLQMAFGWTGDKTLATGEYQATIKVEYSALQEATLNQPHSTTI